MRISPISPRIKNSISFPSIPNYKIPWLSPFLSHVFQNHFVATPIVKATCNGTVWINLTVLQTQREESLEKHPVFQSGLLVDLNETTALDGIAGEYERIGRMRKQHHYYKLLVGKGQELPWLAFLQSTASDSASKEEVQVTEEAKTEEASAEATEEKAETKETGGKGGKKSQSTLLQWQEALGIYKHQMYPTSTPHHSALFIPGSPRSFPANSTTLHAALIDQYAELTEQELWKVELRVNVIKNPSLNGEILAKYLAWNRFFGGGWNRLVDAIEKGGMKKEKQMETKES
jgi:hypothetical protein